MKRIATIMYLKSNMSEEYEKRHDELWTEMKEVLKQYGAHNYSIFLEKETNKLFAYLEVEDEERYDSIKETEVVRSWWKYMAPLMEINNDNSPRSTELIEVFHLD